MRAFDPARRAFLQNAGLGVAALGASRTVFAAEQKRPVQGFETTGVDAGAYEGWKPFSDRKIRLGIVGWGFCQFGSAFGFQDHPNVEVVAVSDLFPERRDGLAKDCRCSKTYDSLEELVKDDSIEAVFVATDPPHHAQHCIDVLNHGKHVAVNVPAVWGSLEEAEQLFDVVKRTGLKYMMFETSYYDPGLYAMHQIYKAGSFGNHVYSEGEYYHYMETPLPSYLGWRDGNPPMWYPTHSNAYFTGVAGGSFTHVSCQGKPSNLEWLKPANNPYKNPYGTEHALFRTSDGGTCRVGCSWDTPGSEGVKGRFRGELGSYERGLGRDGNYGNYEGKTVQAELPNLNRPPLPPGTASGAHDGSHGHLSNEFIKAIIDDRNPRCNVVEALNMTVAGIVAHQSALRDGETMKIPQFTLTSTQSKGI